MTDTPQFEFPRQGSRVVMRVPVEVRAAIADGTRLEESTHTGVVGSMGAMILISKKLPVGTEVELINRFSQQAARFRVAWVMQQPGSEL